MTRAVARLRLHARAEQLDLAPVERLAATVTLQERLTEVFKTDNALLQNSLAYFSLLSSGVGSGGARNPATGALAAAILHLTFDSSTDAARAVDDRLAQAERRWPASGPDTGATPQALLAHARLLRELLPSVDTTIKALLAVPSGAALEATRAEFAGRHAVIEANAQRSRWLLYAACLVLLLLMADLGQRLRSRVLAQRRRAVFEHIIAENSTRLINSPPAETDARLKLVLGELGRASGFERAYIVLDENPPRVHAWSAPGTTYPLGWPERAVDLPAQFGVGAPEVVAVPSVEAAAPRRSPRRLAGRRGSGLGLRAPEPAGPVQGRHGV